MRHGSAWVCLAFAFLVVPVFGADDKKKDADKKTDNKYAASKEDYDALRQRTEATGRLVTVSDTDKSFTLRIDFAVLEPKNKDISADTEAQNLAQVQQQILAQQQQALLIRNPAQRQRRLQQLATQLERAQQNAFKSTVQHKDFDLVGTDEVQVRLSELPQKFDDKGNLVKYTTQELKDLKGKGPGYAGTFDTLDRGQLVKVTFVKKKKTDKDAPDADKIQVSMIYVQMDAPAVDMGDKADKDKKKK